MGIQYMLLELILFVAAGQGCELPSGIHIHRVLTLCDLPGFINEINSSHRFHEVGRESCPLLMKEQSIREVNKSKQDSSSFNDLV